MIEDTISLFFFTLSRFAPRKHNWIVSAVSLLMMVLVWRHWWIFWPKLPPSQRNFRRLLQNFNKFQPNFMTFNSNLKHGPEFWGNIFVENKIWIFCQNIDQCVQGCEGLYVTSYFKTRLEQSSFSSFWSEVEQDYDNYKGKTSINFPEELKGHVHRFLN